MELDFNTLEQSQFFKTGRVFYNGETDNFYKRHWCVYYSLLTNIDDVRRKKTEDIQVSRGAGSVSPSLYRFLDNTVPNPFRDIILDQWIEVETIIKKIPVTPFTGHFNMFPANTGLENHKHSPCCKQTLTFGYRFLEGQVDNGVGSFLSINHKEMPFPDAEKIYFSFTDNADHETFTKEWRFFWVFDYAEYVDVPDLSDFVRMY